jgi:hypothetical protein
VPHEHAICRNIVQRNKYGEALHTRLELGFRYVSTDGKPRDCANAAESRGGLKHSIRLLRRDWHSGC